MKRAIIYKRRDRFIMHSLSRTVDGIWIFSPPYLSLNENCLSADLETAIRTVLSDSKSSVPSPPNSTVDLTPLLSIAGVKSWAAFTRGVSSIDIAASDKRITFTPMRNLGASEGFEQDPAGKVELDECSPELAQRVRELFAV